MISEKKFRRIRLDAGTHKEERGNVSVKNVMKYDPDDGQLTHSFVTKFNT